MAATHDPMRQVGTNERRAALDVKDVRMATCGCPAEFLVSPCGGLSAGKSSAKIHKIHSSEIPCKQFSRWKMEGSSAAEATARKANATGKSFLILRLPATRKFLPILPM